MAHSMPGHTDNLEARIATHEQRTFARYTSTRLPINVVFVEELPSRYEALQMERQIKGWNRAKKEALLRRDWAAVKKLSAVRGSSASPRTGGK